MTKKRSSPKPRTQAGYPVGIPEAALFEIGDVIPLLWNTFPEFLIVHQLLLLFSCGRSGKDKIGTCDHGRFKPLITLQLKGAYDQILTVSLRFPVPTSLPAARTVPHLGSNARDLVDFIKSGAHHRLARFKPYPALHELSPEIALLFLREPVYVFDVFFRWLYESCSFSIATGYRAQPVRTTLLAPTLRPAQSSP